MVKKMSLKSIIFIFIILYYSSATAAIGTIYGLVQEERTGKPIENAKLCLPTVIIGTRCVYSKPDGSYILNTLPEIGYTLFITAAGYKTMEISPIDVPVNGFVNTPVKLRPLFPGSITGVILNQNNGTPVGLANICVSGPAMMGQTICRHSRSSDGRYVLDGIIEGEGYKVKITSAGYMSKEISDIRVLPYRYRKIEIKLTPIAASAYQKQLSGQSREIDVQRQIPPNQLRIQPKEFDKSLLIRSQ
jgi:hypothetical protein